MPAYKSSTFVILTYDTTFYFVNYVPTVDQSTQPFLLQRHFICFYIKLLHVSKYTCHHYQAQMCKGPW